MLGYIDVTKENLFLNDKMDINDLIMIVNIGKKYKPNTNYMVVLMNNMKSKFNINLIYRIIRF